MAGFFMQFYRLYNTRMVSLYQGFVVIVHNCRAPHSASIQFGLAFVAFQAADFAFVVIKQVERAPLAYGFHDGDHADAHFGKCIVYAGRVFFMVRAQDDAVFLEFPQLFGQDFTGDLRQGALQFAEAQGFICEEFFYDGQFPFAADHGQGHRDRAVTFGGIHGEPPMAGVRTGYLKVPV